MKILFFADNFPPEVNAAATRVYERAVYWAKWGHEVTFITSVPNFPQGKVYAGYRNRWYQVEHRDGIRVVRVKTFIAKNSGFLLRTFDFLSYMITSFIAGLFQKKPDVLCVTSPQFFAAIGAWACAKCRRVPFVFELGDLWPKSVAAVGQPMPKLLLRTFENVELFLYRQATSIVALTHAFKQDLVSREIAADKISVVRNGVDLSRYSPKEKDTALLEQYQLAGKTVIGYIGNHGPAQDLSNVISAAASLQNKCPQCVFILVGDGAQKNSLVALAKQRELTNVIFIPSQTKQIISKFWSLCDIALVHLKDEPAFSEVIPSKMFEAMAMGLPLLFVGPEGEASRIVDETKAGVAVLSSNPDLLAEQVVSLLEQPDQLQAYRQSALTQVKQFSREQQAREMVDVLALIKSHTQKQQQKECEF